MTATIDKVGDIFKSSISDVKKAPMDIFNSAKEKHKGVYIFNRDKVAGVVLSQSEYEELQQKIDYLQDQLFYSEVVQRIEANKKDPVFLSDEEVRGEAASVNSYDPNNDDWE